MSNTLKFGGGLWATQEDSVLAYNDENGNYKPLPFEFERDTNATVVNKNGLIETVGNNIPRIDFQGNNKGALLLEPERTNLVTYSEDFGNSDWNKGTGTITTNTAISPDGTLSADKYSAVSTSSFAFLSQTKSADASQSYTYSIWIKKVSGSGVLKLVISDVNLATSNSNNINLTNEFVRYSFSIETGDLSNTGSIGVGFINITSGDVIEVWGAQLEQGSYPTSYIPTSGSAVTRVAEVCSGAGNDQVINSTEGVLYAEMSALADDGTVRSIALSDGTSVNRINIRFRSQSNEVEYSLFVNGQTTKTITHSVSDTTNFHKMAALYKKDDLKFYVNGFLVGSFVSANMLPPNTLNQLNFDSGAGLSDLYGKTKALAVYDTALTDAELQALTTI